MKAISDIDDEINALIERCKVKDDWNTKRERRRINFLRQCRIIVGMDLMEDVLIRDLTLLENKLQARKDAFDSWKDNTPEAKELKTHAAQVSHYNKLMGVTQLRLQAQTLRYILK